jgi:hypothetical protein
MDDDDRRSRLDGVLRVGRVLTKLVGELVSLMDAIRGSR